MYAEDPTAEDRLGGGGKRLDAEARGLVRGRKRCGRNFQDHGAVEADDRAAIFIGRSGWQHFNAYAVHRAVVGRDNRLTDGVSGEPVIPTELKMRRVGINDKEQIARLARADAEDWVGPPGAAVIELQREIDATGRPRRETRWTGGQLGGSARLEPAGDFNVTR